MNEVLATPEVEVTQPVTTEEIVQSPEAEVTLTTPESEIKDETEVDTPEIGISESEIDALLSEILDNKEDKNEPIRPVFPDGKEPIKVDEPLKVDEPIKEESLSEQDLEEIDQIMTTLEEDNKNYQIQIVEKDNKINEYVSENETLKSDMSKLEAGFDLLSNHPILGPLALKVISGEEVDIPKYISDMTTSIVDVIPQMDGLAGVSIHEKKTTPAERLAKIAKSKIY